MCAATVTPVRAIRVDESLDAVLIATHDAWTEEARRLLLPATASDAAVWDRWSMVRYLNEGFLERFNLERALVRELRPFVPVREMSVLEAGEEWVAQLHLALERIGRPGSTAAQLAAVTAELLKALDLWCTELEVACKSVRLDTLPEEARRALENMGAAGRTLVDSR